MMTMIVITIIVIIIIIITIVIIIVAVVDVEQRKCICTYWPGNLIISTCSNILNSTISPIKGLTLPIVAEWLDMNVYMAALMNWI